MASSPVPVEPYQRRSSGVHAARYIRRLIFDGHLRAGGRVHQEEIARALGISRIPVREALIALERQGWVTIEPNRGAFVTSLDERAVRDHYDLYGLVYGFAVERALERSDELLGEKLKQIASDFATVHDAREAQALALTFQETVVDAAGSPRIRVVLRALSALVPGDFYELVPKAVETQRRGFSAIARACQRGDGTRAASEYSKMMRAVGRDVVRLFGERGLLEQSKP
jgi:DNA-binding GntR family transcriptional regulator